MSEVRKAQIKLNMAKAKEQHKTQLKSMTDRLKNVSSPKPMAELSKYTLARYQIKAAPDLASRSMDQGSGLERTAANRRKIVNRSAGIGKAANKLTQKTNEEISEADSKPGEVVQGSAFQDPKDRPKKVGRAKRFYNRGTKKAMASAGMAVIKNREKEREAEEDRQKQKAAERVVGAQSDKRKAAGKKLTDPKTGMEVGKTKQDTKKEIAKAIKPTTKVTVLPAKMPRRRKLRLTSGDEVIFDSENEVLMEDGHSDVASARRKAVLIMEDAAQLLMKLKNMDPNDSLPSWWMNKMSVTAAYMDSMRNYLLVPSMGMEDPDMGTMPDMSTESKHDGLDYSKAKITVIPPKKMPKRRLRTLSTTTSKERQASGQRKGSASMTVDKGERQRLSSRMKDFAARVKNRDLSKLESYSMASSDTSVADKYRKKVIPQQVSEKKKKKELKPMGPTSFGFGSYDTTGNGASEAVDYKMLKKPMGRKGVPKVRAGAGLPKNLFKTKDALKDPKDVKEEDDQQKMKNIDDIMKMYKKRKPLSATVKMGPGMKRLKSKLDAIPSTDKAGRVSRSRIQKKFGSNVLQN